MRTANLGVRTALALLALVATAGRAADAEAATWHVASGRADASDDNPGTALKPWKTISKAAEILQPGDTVIIHAGIYREYVHPAHSGTPSQSITYQGASGEEVVISGADVVTGWVPAGDKVWKRSPGPTTSRLIPQTNAWWAAASRSSSPATCCGKWNNAARCRTGPFAPTLPARFCTCDCPAMPIPLRSPWKSVFGRSALAWASVANPAMRSTFAV